MFVKHVLSRGMKGYIEMMYNSNTKIKKDRMVELRIFSIVKNPAYLSNHFDINQLF